MPPLSDGGPGEVALVLHTHMPYVEGFGTWPFGEEWLWEAVATSYVPLLARLPADAPVTWSVTPVLLDQLEAPGVDDRCLEFLRVVRPASHALDVEACREAGRDDLVAALERSAARYAAAADDLAALPGGPAAALAARAAWTSSATHAVLPLLATDAGLHLQLRTGVEAHRRRPTPRWRGGFWLPECAYAPWLDPLLGHAGVHATAVELTDVFGEGDERHLTPLATPDGPVLVPIDRALIDPVWGAAGYPSHAAYRDYHHRTARDHRIWANDGAVYDEARAQARVRADAADWVGRLAERVAGGGLCVVAFDTELFGHWWFEGPDFLAAVLDEAAAQGLRLSALDDALRRADPVPAPPPARTVTTWGDPHTLWTWSGPQVADLVTAQRAAEIAVVGRAPDVTALAARELLALQASDWAFLHTREQAGPYARERHDAHRRGVEAALEGVPSGTTGVRHLAPHMSLAPLLEP